MRWRTEDQRWEVWTYEPAHGPSRNIVRSIYLFEHEQGELDEWGNPDPAGKIRAVWYPPRGLGRVSTDGDVMAGWDFIDTDNVTQHEEVIRTACGAEPADLFSLAVETIVEAS